MAKVRFIDNLKVGAYSSNNGKVSINNNVNDYVLTATGGDTLQGESGVIIKNSKLGIGTTNPTSWVEINKDSTEDLILIKNSTTGEGLKVTKDGILQLIEFTILPTSIAGGIAYSGSNFWVGLP